MEWYIKVHTSLYKQKSKHSMVKMDFSLNTFYFGTSIIVYFLKTELHGMSTFQYIIE